MIKNTEIVAPISSIIKLRFKKKEIHIISEENQCMRVFSLQLSNTDEMLDTFNFFQKQLKYKQIKKLIYD